MATHYRKKANRSCSDGVRSGIVQTLMLTSPEQLLRDDEGYEYVISS